MENYVNAIRTIEELNAKLEEKQEEIRVIDTEAASLSAIEGDNKLEVQEQRLSDLEKAIAALSTDSAKKVVQTEIDAIKVSIKNINRMFELADLRVKTLQKTLKLSNDLITVIGTYKGYRMNFEKRFNKVSRDTLKLLDKEDIPEEAEEAVEEVEETVEEEEVVDTKENNIIFTESLSLTAANEEGVEETQGLVVSEEETNSENVEEPAKNDALFFEEEVIPHPLIALSRVLKSYEELTSQDGADKYLARYASMYKEMEVTDKDKTAISQLLDKSEVPGLTKEQVQILWLSMPKEIIYKLGRKDVISERRNATQVYAVGFLNSLFRPEFTYKVIAELCRLVIKEEESANEKAMKIELFFKNNSDCMVKGKFGGTKPQYRAFAVLRNEDLIEA